MANNTGTGRRRNCDSNDSIICRRDSAICYDDNISALGASSVWCICGLTLNLVKTVNGGSIEPDENSPVLVMGDSHTLVFHDPTLLSGNAGLVDHLSARFGFPVDLIGTRGSGSIVRGSPKCAFT